MSDLRTIRLIDAMESVHVYGTILIDLQGIVQSWNQGATELLGYAPDEAVGRHFEFIFSPEDRELQAPRLEMEKALSETYAYDDRWHLRRDQTRIYVNGGLCLLQNENAQAIGFVKIIRDQTEKMGRLEHIQDLNLKLRQSHEQLHDYAEQLEERVGERTHELAERNRELEAFCYAIAHDLRGPLRSIQTMSQVIIEDFAPTLDSACRDYLNRIVQAGMRLDRLTLDLLAYSRLSREEIKLGTVDLEKALDEAISGLCDAIKTSGAEIKVHRPLPKVRAQQSCLGQILSQLLSNALKFVVEGVKPVIEIRAETSDKTVNLFVTDNGIGISEEYRDKIFQLFERLHPDGTYTGTGVGLAIAQKAAERINGRIELESSAAGPGTTFRLELEAAS